MSPKAVHGHCKRIGSEVTVNVSDNNEGKTSPLNKSKKYNSSIKVMHEERIFYEDVEASRKYKPENSCVKASVIRARCARVEQKIRFCSAVKVKEIPNNKMQKSRFHIADDATFPTYYVKLKDSDAEELSNGQENTSVNRFAEENLSLGRRRSGRLSKKFQETHLNEEESCSLDINASLVHSTPVSTSTSASINQKNHDNYNLSSESETEVVDDNVLEDFDEFFYLQAEEIVDQLVEQCNASDNHEEVDACTIAPESQHVDAADEENTFPTDAGVPPTLVQGNSEVSSQEFESKFYEMVHQPQHLNMTTPPFDTEIKHDILESACLDLEQNVENNSMTETARSEEDMPKVKITDVHFIFMASNVSSSTLYITESMELRSKDEESLHPISDDVNFHNVYFEMTDDEDEPEEKGLNSRVHGMEIGYGRMLSQKQNKLFWPLRLLVALWAMIKRRFLFSGNQEL